MGTSKMICQFIKQQFERIAVLLSQANIIDYKDNEIRANQKTNVRR